MSVPPPPAFGTPACYAPLPMNAANRPEPSNAARRGLALARVALALLGAGLAILLVRLDLFEAFAEPSRFARALEERGGLGYLAFVGAFTILQPFGVPGTVFVVAAPFVWPWPIAFLLSMLGTMAASVVGFLFARFLARDWVLARIPERLRRYEALVAEHGFAAVFGLRLVLWMPQPLHWFFGVSRVSFATHFWGSLLGYALPLGAVSYFAGTVFDGTGGVRSEAFVPMGVFVLVTFVIAVAVARTSARLAARSAE